MSASDKYDEIRARIAAVRELLTIDDESHPQWLEALESIELFLAGDQSERGFSIVRSLDAYGPQDGPVADAMIAVSAALRESGIDRYR